ncbi:reverse transcriptase (RNA-dependent DNA polymerase) [Desulfosporosinus acididurans]|uniref:Reverse transcriptase (RNA-dependent DNA polymerase) n=1 Tax=Desulfosporosinus acididurans TaxID=476652 RepID=A0A0J1FTH4_9FIRM|nr:reverse transcriptase/maturase family protein [Desulfosporosinus acididurans]KLU66775.1 reverse transcriptase (RNA-dependent DNA polymerase) [Desulfosporosinus acididurans]
MHKIRGLYEKIYDFENLHQAYLEARKGKRYRIEVMKFTNHLEENLIQIQNELIWKTYEVGKYREFFVNEPKKRLIMALPFKDRVVQWAIYQVLNPYFEKGFIQDSYACRVDKGTHRAVNRLQYWLRYMHRRHSQFYALKLDISKYFYRVDHNVLMAILRRRIGDEDLLWLLETIARCEHTKFGVPLGDHQFESDRVGGVGMPIGNLTSQMFANLYLNELDQYAKQTLHVKFYLRYMDDIVVLHGNKKYLWALKEQIDEFVVHQLHLQLNNKTMVRSVSQGIEFVGFRVWPTHKKLRKKSALKMKRRLRYLQRSYARGEIGMQEVNNSVQSYLGILKHCNSHNLKTKLLRSLTFVRDNLN